MTHELLAQALKSSQSGESLSEDVQEWLLTGLIAYISDDVGIDIALGLNGVEKRTWWLNARNTALREAWTVIKETTDLSNRKAAHVLFEMLEDNQVVKNNLNQDDNVMLIDDDLATLVSDIRAASDHCGHIKSGESTYQVIWSMINGLM